MSSPKGWVRLVNCSYSMPLVYHNSHKATRPSYPNRIIKLLDSLGNNFDLRSTSTNFCGISRMTLAEYIDPGGVTLEGNADAFRDFLSMLDTFEFWFNIVTPSDLSPIENQMEPKMAWTVRWDNRGYPGQVKSDVNFFEQSESLICLIQDESERSALVLRSV